MDKQPLPEGTKVYVQEPAMLAKMEDWFTYHRPFGDQGDRYELLRAAGGEFAKTILMLTPPSAEQTLALRDVQRAVMMANAAIALNEKES